MSDYKYSLASDCYYRGQYDQAIELLKELLAEEPNVASYHGLLAGCLLGRKRMYAAEYELSIALRLDPSDGFLFIIKARLHVFKNELTAALDACDEAFRLEPEYLEAMLLKAHIYLIQEESSKVKASIDLAAKLFPDSGAVTRTYGRYYYSIGDLDKAEEHATHALSKSPQDEEANLLMGKIRLKQGNVAEAEYHAKFVILENPQSGEALRLFCNIKMHNSILLGGWWRFNSWIASMSSMKSSVILISGYLLFMFTAQILNDLGFSTASAIASFSWIALVLYSWFGIPMYYKRLQKELSQFSFNPKF